MKVSILLIAAACLVAGCNKIGEKIVDKSTSPSASRQFIKFSIQKGNQYCDGNAYKAIETGEMKFVAKFDSTAIYETQSPENQYDINKPMVFRITMPIIINLVPALDGAGAITPYACLPMCIIMALLLGRN